MYEPIALHFQGATVYLHVGKRRVFLKVMGGIAGMGLHGFKDDRRVCTPLAALTEYHGCGPARSRIVAVVHRE